MKDPNDDNEFCEDSFDPLDGWYDKAIASGQGFKTPEERQAYIDSLGDPLKHPMFAQSMEDMEGHPLVEAIRSLKEDNKTPMELAMMYKDEGNDFIKNSSPKSQKESFVRYTIALDHLERAEQQSGTTMETSSPEPRQSDNNQLTSIQNIPQLKSQILSNRALVSLNLKNYGQCCKDCNIAIQLWNRNLKAHYRKIKALSLLRRFDEVIRASDFVLQSVPTNKEVSTPQTTTTAADEDEKWMSAIRKLKEDTTKILERRKKEMEAVDAGVRAKWLEAWDVARREEWTLGEWVPGQLDLAAQSTAVTDPWALLSAIDPLTMRVEVTIVLMYPEHGQHDIIQSCGLDDMVAEHLIQALPEEGEGEPPSWDSKGEYRASTAAIYVQVDSAQRPRGSCLSRNLWTEACKQRYDLMRGRGDGGDSAARRTKEEQLAASFKFHPLSFIDVHPGCTVKDIIKARGCVLFGGLLSLTVYSRGNSAHNRFLASCTRDGVFSGILQPGGLLMKEETDAR